MSESKLSVSPLIIFPFQGTDDLFCQCLFLLGACVMATAPKRPCAKAGCRELVDTGYCIKHQSTKTNYDRLRPSSSKRGYGHRWRVYRDAYLRDHPLCVSCNTQNVATAATVVDHIKPHNGNDMMFWEPLNHQSLCASCHGRKTAMHDGGFGNPNLKGMGSEK